MTLQFPEPQGFFSVHVVIVSCQELKSLIRSMGKTAKFTCGVDGIYVIHQGLHWYHQDSSKAIKWLLFYKPGTTEAVNEYKTRISLEISTESSCTLSITNIKPTDDGTYFCAAWQNTTVFFLLRKSSLCKDANMKKFGTGTKLLVIDQKARKPDVTILGTSKEIVKDTGSAILLCSLQNFFPDVINVVWRADGGIEVLESEQGEIIKNASSDLSSLYSWITIKKPGIGKIYKCKYQHEGNQRTWEEVEYDTAIFKDTEPDKTKNGNCTNSAGGVHIRHTIIRAAQLTYTLLLLKCLMYCPFLLVCKCKFLN
ncbi:immunoglobulin kappa light chain-like [Bufo gargarizans]|uniref:immunoglobulin kappa light chain-like n=1 Tax=Bufo gargarizans TaxID=30331 RepID=UPI001CF37CDC|nr:immunoglobulin kappa light chain-like [Bufo gargarizans]